MGEAALTPLHPAGEEPSSTELVLIACELARAVECRPQRDDGTDAAVYASSGPTLARRIKAGARIEVSRSEAATEPGLHPAAFSWTVAMRVGAVRNTHYQVWLDESPEQIRELWRARKRAQDLRGSLTHSQRKKKPWGPL